MKFNTINKTIILTKHIYIFYPQDNNGTIENEELTGFLKDLVELAQNVRCNFLFLFKRFFYLKKNFNTQDYDAQDLKVFEETILHGVGYDKAGKFSKKELTMILLALSKKPGEE